MTADSERESDSAPESSPIANDEEAEPIILLAQTQEAPAPSEQLQDEAGTHFPFDTTADTQLLSEVLSKPLFGAMRWKGIWEGITSRLNSKLNANFTARACRDRASLLLRQHAVRQEKNKSASGGSEAHTDSDDVLEELSTLKKAAAETKVSKRLGSSSESETQGIKRRRLAVLIESEQEETVARRQLEEKKVDLQLQDLQVRREKLEEQLMQRKFMQQQMQEQTKRTEKLMETAARPTGAA
ncbi:hypothetical protein PHMEG_00022231 [Phytophthora megakarya]|uniref:Uncharacterized protein n=1 Tax=Phytophthora megakarya TaxID=4795 RepID=A0A225VKN7_9STRA|nr:hypothetical protein PHMEG_00022231 [Phytophthora megakarya]